MLFAFLCTYQSAASQSPQTIMLKPNHGFELTTVVSYIRAYRECVDRWQQQKANNRNNNFNRIQKNQCQTVYLQLEQSVDQQSLQLIEQLVKNRWYKRELGLGFTPERIAKKSTALMSGESSK